MISITVLFFASFKQRLNTSKLELEIADRSSINDVCKQLAVKGEIWKQLFDQPKEQVKIAINQQLGSSESLVANGDEIAFFPPVTGG